MNTKTSQNRDRRISVTSLDYYTIIKDLLHNWWVVLLAGAIAFMGVNVVANMLHRPQYTSTATLMVTGTANNYNSFATYASDAERFAGILTDEYVLQEVAESLNLERIGATVEATVIADTNLLNLSVTADSPTKAFQVGRGIMDHYKDISSLMYPNYNLMELVPVSYPSGPSNSVEVSSLTKKMVLAAVLGMILIIAVCSCLYDNIKNYRDAEEKLDTPVFGIVYHEKKKSSGRKKKKTSIMVTDPLVSSGFVESYKHLRERVVSRCRASGKNVILITSMQENEGKSTIAANLALSLAAVSKNVLLIDGDLRKPAQYKIFEVKGGYIRFTKYLKKEASWQECIYESNRRNLKLILETEGSSNSTEIIDTPPFEALIRELRDKMDYIIIDTPPLAQVSDAEAIAKVADYSIMVLSPDNSKTDIINDCIADLEACNAKLLGCVLNNVHTVSRWIYQNLHVDVSRFIASNVNDYSFDYASSYGGYGAERKKGKSKKNQSGTAHHVESAESFFVASEPMNVGEEVQDE